MRLLETILGSQFQSSNLLVWFKDPCPVRLETILGILFRISWFDLKTLSVGSLFFMEGCLKRALGPDPFKVMGIISNVVSFSFVKPNS